MKPYHHQPIDDDLGDDGDDGSYEGDDIDAFNDETFGNAGEWDEDEHEQMVARDEFKPMGEPIRDLQHEEAQQSLQKQKHHQQKSQPQQQHQQPSQQQQQHHQLLLQQQQLQIQHHRQQHQQQQQLHQLQLQQQQHNQNQRQQQQATNNQQSSSEWSPFGGRDLFSVSISKLSISSPPQTPTLNNVRDDEQSEVPGSKSGRQGQSRGQRFHQNNHQERYSIMSSYSGTNHSSRDRDNRDNNRNNRHYGQQQQQQQMGRNSNVKKTYPNPRAPMIVPPRVQLSVIEEARRHTSVTALHPDEYIQDRVPTIRDGFLFRRHSQSRIRQHDGTLNDKEKTWLIKVQQQIQARIDDDENEDWYYLAYKRRNTHMTGNDLLKLLQQKQPILQLGNKLTALPTSAPPAPPPMASDQSSSPCRSVDGTSTTGCTQYSPRQFVGSLGKITVSNVNRPRRLLDMES